MMLRKLKYTTALLLLVIFPLSAIGVDVSVHNCKHKGISRWSFFKSDSENGACCCSMASNKLSPNKKVMPCCQKKLNQNHKTNSGSHIKHSCCSDGKKYENTQKAANSEQPVQIKESDNGYILSNNTGEKLQKIPCCTYLNKMYAVSVASDSPQNPVNIIQSPQLVDILFLLFNHDTQPDNNQTVKNLKYPLKKPVCHIISFIYLTSNTEDDTDLSAC